MITPKHNSSSLKVSWPPIMLSSAGAILNLIALFSDDNGALVAVGCSLIAIGVATTKRKPDR